MPPLRRSGRRWSARASRSLKAVWRPDWWRRSPARIRGRGAHAAHPHKGVDPVVAQAAIVQNAQSIVSRSLDPFAPTVVSGPYFITVYNLNHCVANENDWQGAPKIKYLNINVLASSQLYSGLQSGEIDLVQQTTGDILLEDYENVLAPENITTYAGTPVTNQSIFINVQNVPDVRIRQALTDQDEIRARCLLADRYVQQDVPMISAYILSALGATSSRLVNATPDVFGAFINIHEWDIAG